MRAERLLILGCGGFIGSHLLDRLLARPELEVVGWDPCSDKIAHLLDHPRFTLRRTAIGEEDTRARLHDDIAVCDWIVNLAAICNPSRYNIDPLRQGCCRWGSEVDDALRRAEARTDVGILERAEGICDREDASSAQQPLKRLSREEGVVSRFCWKRYGRTRMAVA